MNYYRKFIKGFSAIALPLTTLLHKDREYIWKKSEQKVFDQLKQYLISAPVLVLPDSKLPFIIITDISDFAIRAVLSQNHDKNNQSIVYELYKLNHTKQNYLIYKKKLLAIIYAICFWKLYLKD